MSFILTLCALAAGLLMGLYALNIWPFNDANQNQVRKATHPEPHPTSNPRRGFGRRER